MNLTTSKGSLIHLDDEDAPLLAGLTLSEDAKGGVKVWNRDLGYSVGLSRLIMGLERGDQRYVRHRDGDHHNCRRENLFLVSREKSYSMRDRTNAGNSSRERRLEGVEQPHKSTSRYRGVTQVHPNGVRDRVGYQARFTVNRKTLSSFHPDEESAARAYDRLRTQHGLSAINFPEARA